MKNVALFPLLSVFLALPVLADDTGLPDTQKILADRQAAYSQIYQNLVANPSQSPADAQKAGQQILQSVNEETDSLVRKRQEERDNYLYKNAFFSDGRVLPRNSADASTEIERLKQLPADAADSGSRAPASSKKGVVSDAPSAPAEVVVDGSNVPKEIVFPGPQKPKSRQAPSGE